VSCEELGVPRSKQDSFQAANIWWRQKLAEIQRSSLEANQSEALKDIEKKISYAAAHAPRLLPDLKRAKKAVLAAEPGDRVLPDQDVINENIRIAELFGISVPKTLDPMVSQHFFGDRRIWEERLEGACLIGKERTIGHCTETFLNEIQPKLRPKSFKEIYDYLYCLVDKSGIWTRTTDVAVINEDTVSNHYLWLDSRHYSVTAHNHRMGHFRRFVYWLWVRRKLADLPRNLRSNDHKKEKEHREIARYDSPLVRETIAELPSPIQLWALLGLNCGMTNADLGALDWSQINQRSWILTRRRVKTGKNPKVPTVKYKLWPEVIERLQALLPQKSGLVFTTLSDGPMYHTRFVEGEATKKAKVTDNFAQRWAEIKPRPRIPLSHFKKVSATALKSDNRFARFTDYFLGHTPKTIADQHYGPESDEPFFEALEFVHDRIFKTASEEVE